MLMSPMLARCGGGEPKNLAGTRSLVGLGCCMTSCGIIKSLGLFGDRSSGVGGSTSMIIRALGVLGIGRITGVKYIFDGPKSLAVVVTSLSSELILKLGSL